MDTGDVIEVRGSGSRRVETVVHYSDVSAKEGDGLGKAWGK